MFRKTGYALLAATLALSVSTLSPANAAEKLRLTMASGHPEVFLWIKHLKATFIPTLTEELKKYDEIEIEWTEGYGGTIVKIGSEVDAFQQGIMDVGPINPVFNPATAGIMNLTYAMPFGPAEPRLVTKAAESALEGTGTLDKLADTIGAVYIGGGFTIDDYNIACKKPVEKLADLAGVKVAGAGPNLAWLRTTDAVGVQGSYVTFYNDLKTGVYDCNIGWMTANTPAKIYEVAPYFNMVHFGAMYVGGLGVATDRWNSFSDNTKNAFRVAAKAYQDAYFDEQDARYESAKKTMLDNGGKIVEFSDEDRAKWIAAMPNPATEWIAAAEARGEDPKGVLKAYQGALKDAGFTFVRDYLSE